MDTVVNADPRILVDSNIGDVNLTPREKVMEIRFSTDTGDL